MVFERFKKGIFFMDWHFGWAPGNAVGILSISNCFFHISIGKVLALFKYLGKWKPFLVSSSEVRI